MDFLSLCKKARHEARISGDGPATVNNQIGVLGDVVEAVNDAWYELQLLHPTWLFMQGQATVELSSGQLEYSAGDLGAERLAKVRQVYVGTRRLREVFGSDYEFMEQLSAQSGEPTHFYFSPDRKLRLLPAPANSVGVTLRFVKSPSRLAENTDEPDIPAEYRPVIVWAAVMKLVANESDSVIFQKAMEHYDNYLLRLQDDFLPAMKFGSHPFL